MAQDRNIRIAAKDHKSLRLVSALTGESHKVLFGRALALLLAEHPEHKAHFDQLSELKDANGKAALQK